MSATIRIRSPSEAPVASISTRWTSSERNLAAGPLRPSAVTDRYTRPFAPNRFARSVSSSVSRRVAPPRPGATIALTRPPDASMSSNTRKPDPPPRTGPRSTSSIPKRTSGLSEPNRSMTSSYVNRGNGISPSGRSGRVARDTSMTIDSTKPISASSSMKLISRSSWVNSGCRSPRRSSSR